MAFEGAPAPRILPGVESKKNTERKYKKMTDLLEGYFDDVNVSQRPTVLDFHGLSPHSTENDYLRWIEKVIGVDPEDILSENKEIYFRINAAYQIGKDFLQNTLGYTAQETSLGPNSIARYEDVVSLLEKTKLAKGKEKGLGQSLKYCRIVKATIVAYETLRNDAELLEELTEEFKKKLLVRPEAFSDEKPAPLIISGEDTENVRFYAAEHGGLKGHVATRAKELEKAMLRFINRPEASAEKALEDGVAVRITIKESQAVELVPIIVKWLRENTGSDFVNIANKNFLSKENEAKLRDALSSDLSADDFYLAEGVLNAVSGGDFQAMVIKGAQRFSGDEREGVSAHARQYEIQIVAPENRNEDGYMHHDVYDAAKYVTARTRIDGGCPQRAFEKFVSRASFKSGKSDSTVKRELLKSRDSIVKLRENGGKGKIVYVAYPVYKRWREIGWVDGEFFETIEQAREHQKNS